MKTLNELLLLDLDTKIHIAESRVLEYVQKMGGKDHVYISFSGGKDSTVLLHLVRSIFPDVVAVFSDTGLEFPEIKEFVKSVDNCITIRPKLSFREILLKYGYPIVSKEVCDTIYYSKKNSNSFRFKQKLSGELKGKSMYDQSKWAYLLDAPFDCNANCCRLMKKEPFREFKKINKKYPIIGTTVSESLLRKRAWTLNGCNNFTKGNEKSAPLSLFTENDIWAYIRKYNLAYSKIYDMGYKRTGCVFCAFGAHLEKPYNRFDQLKLTHPNLYNYMMKPIDQGGLGFRIPLDYIGVKEKDNIQQNLELFIDTD